MKKKNDILTTVSRLPCLACPLPTPEELGWIRDNIDQAPRISDPHHVTTVGAGGKDEPTNVMPLCRRHHDLWHRLGGREMARRYAGVRAWLEFAQRDDILLEAGQAPY